MQSKVVKWQKCRFIHNINAVVHVLRIAAFFILTKNDIFRYRQPDFLIYAYSDALDYFEVRLFLHLFKGCRNGCPHCRSPPSDFDLVHQLKNQNRRIIMKKINLRDFYPFYTKDTVVEVSEKVALLLREYELLEEAYRIRTYRHKAFYSLDYEGGIERDLAGYVKNGVYILKQKQINGDNGSIQDEWSRLNMEPELTMEELEYLKKINAAKISIQEIEVTQNTLEFDMVLEPNEIQFLYAARK